MTPTRNGLVIPSSDRVTFAAARRRCAAEQPRQPLEMAAHMYGPQLTGRRGLSCGHWQPTTMRLRRRGRPVRSQGGNYVVDNPRTYEHAEMADAIDRDVLYVGVGGHRPQAWDDDVQCSGNRQPPLADGYRTGG